MKRTLMYALILAAACGAAGCMRDVFDFTDEEEFGFTDNAGNGRVAFDNALNKVPVYVYSAQARTEDVLIAVVLPGETVDKMYDGRPIEYPPTHGERYKFYLAYQLCYRGYDGAGPISFPYAPAEDQGAFVVKTIKGGGEINTVEIPAPLCANDEPLVTDVYLVLRTRDAGGLTLQKGVSYTSTSIPTLSGVTGVDPGATALYKLPADEDFTAYKVDFSGAPVAFDAAVTADLAPGMLCIYEVSRNGFTRVRAPTVINVNNLWQTP